MSFDQILNFIQSQNEFIIYGILVIGLFIENIFPPFPGDTLTIAGALIAGKGHTSYIGVYLSATLGGLLGALFLYYLGKNRGRQYFKSNSHFGESALMKVESLFSRFGDMIIVFSRFFIGIRSAVSVAAGLGDVALPRMALLTLTGFIIWNGLILGLVFYSKSSWNVIAAIGKKYNYMILTVSLAAIAILLSRWLWKRSRS